MFVYWPFERGIAPAPAQLQPVRCLGGRALKLARVLETPRQLQQMARLSLPVRTEAWQVGTQHGRA